MIFSQMQECVMSKFFLVYMQDGWPVLMFVSISI